jgi:hypothetical protein
VALVRGGNTHLVVVNTAWFGEQLPAHLDQRFRHTG